MKRTDARFSTAWSVLSTSTITGAGARTLARLRIAARDADIDDNYEAGAYIQAMMVICSRLVVCIKAFWVFQYPAKFGMSYLLRQKVCWKSYVPASAQNINQST